MSVSDYMLRSLFDFYCYKNDFDVNDALKTLDNDIALVLNEEQPLSELRSEFLENRKYILDKLYVSVSDDQLVSHVCDIWAMLEISDQTRVFKTLVGCIPDRNK